MKNSYTQQQKYKQAGFKMRRGVKQTLFQRRHRGSQQAHKKMFNITDYWAIANKNHNGGGNLQWDIISSLSEWLFSKRQEIKGVGEDMEKRELS